MKTLAVVVLNWNGLSDTRALLPTLAACRVPAGWRLQTWVVDNGSADGSAAAIAAEFPAVRLVTLGENRRFAGGNNEGVRRALAEGADAVALLNNDTHADPGLFEHLLLALEQHTGPAAAAPLNYYGVPSDRIWYAGGRISPEWGLASHRGLRERDRGQYREVEETGYLTGCCLIAQREVWEKVGLLDERYFIYAEDADWCLRARSAGVALLFVPTARLWHSVSASSGAMSPWKIYQRTRANLTLFATHARGLGRLTWWPAYAAQELVRMVWLMARGQAAAAWALPRAFADAGAGKAPGEVQR